MATAQTLQVTLEFDATGAVKSAKSAADGFDKMGKEAEKGRGMVAKLGSGLLSFGKGVLSAVTSLKALVVAFAAFASVRVVANSLLAVTEQIDALNDRAAQLNVTTEALSALGTAAQLNGSSFEGMAAALAKLSLNIGMAAEGSKETTAIFKKLGVEFKTANGDIRATDDVLLDVADGLQRLGSQAERSRVAAQLFGREAGPRLLQLLSQGKAGIEAMRREAEFFGVVISTKLAGDIADFRDSLDRLGFAFQGIRIALTENLIVPLTDYINGLATVIASNRDSIVGAITSITEGIVKVAIGVGNIISGIFSDLADGKIPSFFKVVWFYIKTQAEAWYLEFEIWVRKKVIDLANAVVKSLPKNLKDFLGISDAEIQDSGVAKMGVKVEQLNVQLAQAGSLIGDLASGGFVTDTLDWLKDIGNDLTGVAQSTDKANESMSRFRATLEGFKNTFGGAFDGINASLEEFKKQSLDTATQTSAAFTGLFNSAKSSATQFFESVISGNMTAKDAFKAFIKSMISSLIALAAQMIVIIGLALILNALGFGLPAIAGGAATVGSGLGGLGAAGVGGATSGSPAGGGQVLVGSPAKSFPRIAPSTLGQPSQTNVTINAMDAKSFAAFASNPENARTMQSVVNGRNATSV